MADCAENSCHPRYVSRPRHLKIPLLFGGARQVASLAPINDVEALDEVHVQVLTSGCAVLVQQGGGWIWCLGARRISTATTWLFSYGWTHMRAAKTHAEMLICHHVG